ncbi:MAG: RNA polymerase sigma factor [Ruminococcaceae bacterium]|nr:RNA polymerase sigma factor [Oscillospiraceae bacterium]
MNDRDAACYRRFLDGDEQAFDELMNTLFFKLVFFIDSYVHDRHTAEDLAVDVFADLVLHRHRYNFKSSLKSYLFMRGRCRAIDCLRHRKVLSFVELSEIAELADDGKTLEELLLTDERKRAVHTALNALPEDQRTAVHLVYFEEMSYKEAATVMKKSAKQVDNLLVRAKKALRDLLGKDGEDL